LDSPPTVSLLSEIYAIFNFTQPVAYLLLIFMSCWMNKIFIYKIYFK
jgi:hypothetical protein